jgi:hypothetical protein
VAVAVAGYYGGEGRIHDCVCHVLVDLGHSVEPQLFVDDMLYFLITGVVFSISGAIGHPVGGRKYWY